MGTANAFGQGVEVTMWGMGLVFLTLIIVALTIWLLDKIFKPKHDDGDEVDDADPVSASEEPEQAAPPITRLADEAAAIVAAIAMERGRTTRATAPAARRPFLAAGGDEDVTGEVVTVAQVDAGSGMWKNAVRLKSAI